MKNKQRVKIALIISAAVIVLAGAALVWFSMFSYNIDVSRLNSGEAPLYVYRDDCVLDGGTLTYRGLGYTIVKWRRNFTNTELKKGDFEELADIEDLTKVYVCGWDIYRGGELDALRDDPDPERTIDFRFEIE